MARRREFDDATVVAAARDVFWEYGYVGTSLARLTAATGLSKSSLYETYGSKRDLFDRALRQYIETVMNPFLEPLERDHAGGPEIEGFFRAFGAYFRTSPACVAARGCLVLNTVTELPHLDDGASEVVRQFRDRVRRALRNAAGHALPPADAQRAADLLAAAHVGLLTTARTDVEQAIALAETIADDVHRRLSAARLT